MAADITPQAFGNGSEGPEFKAVESQNTERHEDSATSEHPQERGVSSAKGLLQEAIRKVMEEIEHHENEAKKHLQQAAELRKDLRESIAFLQEQGEKGQRFTIRKNAESGKADSPPKEEKTGALPATSSKRTRGKRK
jgi:hypothetical protein